MTRRLRISHTAARDIEQIVAYIVRDRKSAARNWLQSTDRLFRLIAATAEIGESCKSSRHKQLRRIAHGKYIVYFRPIGDDIEIIRVVHGARDQDKLI